MVKETAVEWGFKKDPWLETIFLGDLEDSGADPSKYGAALFTKSGFNRMLIEPEEGTDPVPDNPACRVGTFKLKPD